MMENDKTFDVEVREHDDEYTITSDIGDAVYVGTEEGARDFLFNKMRNSGYRLQVDQDKSFDKTYQGYTGKLEDIPLTDGLVFKAAREEKQNA